MLEEDGGGGRGLDLRVERLLISAQRPVAWVDSSSVVVEILRSTANPFHVRKRQEIGMSEFLGVFYVLN